MQTNTAINRTRAWRAAGGLLIGFLIFAVSLGVVVWRAPIWFDDQLTRFQLARAGIHSRWLVLEGMNIHYIEGGAGKPIVLVHGLASEAQRDWARLAPDLVHAGYHVYAPDLPGFGQSDKPNGRTYSIPEQAAFVASFLDANHLSETALAGLSMGGWIAATVALKQPRRVSRLLLFDSAGLLFKPPFDPALFTPRSSEEIDRLLELVGEPARLPAFVKNDFLELTKRDGWVVQRALRSMLAGGDVLDSRFSALKMPLLIVWGRLDRVTPLPLAESMHAAAPQSILAVCDGAGHVAQLTCADRITPVVLAFLAGGGPRPGETITLTGPKR